MVSASIISRESSDLATRSAEGVHGERRSRSLDRQAVAQEHAGAPRSDCGRGVMPHEVDHAPTSKRIASARQSPAGETSPPLERKKQNGNPRPRQNLTARMPFGLTSLDKALL